MARLTMSTRNLAGVQANLRQYNAGARLRTRAVVLESMDRTFALAQDLCPRDTNYMAEHMHADPTPSGFGYEVGFDAADFVGHTNPVNGRKITSFYPVFTEFGTVKSPAQPCIFPARDAEAPRFKRALKEALSPRGVQPRGR